MSDIACNEPVEDGDLSLNFVMLGLASLMLGAVAGKGPGPEPLFPTSVGYNTEKIDQFADIFKEFYQKNHMFGSLPFWSGAEFRGNQISFDEVTAANIRQFFSNLRYNNSIINLFDDIFNNDTSLPRQTEVKNIIARKVTTIIKEATAFFAQQNPNLHNIPQAGLRPYQSSIEYIRLREQSYLYYRKIFSDEWAKFFAQLEVPVRVPPPPKPIPRTAREVAAEALEKYFKGVKSCSTNIGKKGGKALAWIGPLIILWRIAEARSTGEGIDAVLQTLNDELDWTPDSPSYFAGELEWRRLVREAIELCTFNNYSIEVFLEIVRGLASQVGREWTPALETLVNEIYDDLQPVIEDSLEYKKTIRKYRSLEKFAQEALDAANEAWDGLDDNAPCNNNDVKERMRLLKIKLQEMEQRLQKQIDNRDLPQVMSINFKNIVDAQGNLSPSIEQLLEYLDQDLTEPEIQCVEECCTIINPCDNEDNFMTSINSVNYSGSGGGFSATFKEFSTGYDFYDDSQGWPPPFDYTKYVSLSCGGYASTVPPDPEKTVVLMATAVLEQIPSASNLLFGYLYEEDLTPGTSYSIIVNSSDGISSGLVTINAS